MKPTLRTGSSLAWVVAAVLMLGAPWVFHGSFALTLLTQMGTLAIFALSYNMLLGQGGMLSFGHAVYVGLGSFIAIHTMNLAAKGSVPAPLVFIPIAGGLGGAFFVMLFGMATTKKSGTT